MKRENKSNAFMILLFKLHQRRVSESVIFSIDRYAAFQGAPSLSLSLLIDFRKIHLKRKKRFFLVFSLSVYIRRCN